MGRNLKEWFLLFVAAAVLILGLGALLQSSSRSKSITLSISGGDALGIRHRLATQLGRDSEPSGLELQVIPTAGSETALEEVNAGRLDLALIQGAIPSDGLENVRQLTPLHIEPLHLLVKRSISDTISKEGISSLAGHSINRGLPGSGTYLLANEVLEFAGLKETATDGFQQFVSNTQSYSDLKSAKVDELPDAVFTVSTLPSPIAAHLIEAHGYLLIPLPFANAFSLQENRELGKGRSDVGINRTQVVPATIPPFAYSLRDKVPREPLNTLGTRLILVANRHIDNATVSRFLEVVFRSDIAKTDRPSLDQEVLNLPTEFPLHEGARSFQQRNKPLIAGDAIDFLEKILAISATVAGGVFFVFQWYRQASRKRRVSNFAQYMSRVIAIEGEAMQNELSAHLDLGGLIQLQRELAEIKAEAVARFVEGRIEGEGQIQGFLALVNDTKEQLTRLILHERDNIEELAAAQRADPTVVWEEQLKTGHPNTDRNP